MDEAPHPAPPLSGEGSSAPAGAQLPLWPQAPDAPPSELLPASEPVLKPDPPWSLSDLGAFVLFAAITFLFANVMATAGFLLLQRGFGWDIALEEVFMKTPFIVSMQVLWEILWLLFIYFTITAKYRRNFWQAIRWVRVEERKVAFFFGGIALAVLIQVFFQLVPSEKHLPIEELFSSAESAYLLTFFGICMAPFIEELVFRGFFYPVFERRWGFVKAVLLTALLFAIIHAPQLSGGWQEMASIYLVGVVLSYSRGRTGSLVPPFLIHLGYNATLFVSLYLTTDRFRTLHG